MTISYRRRLTDACFESCWLTVGNLSSPSSETQQNKRASANVSLKPLIIMTNGFVKDVYTERTNSFILTPGAPKQLVVTVTSCYTQLQLHD